MNKIVRKIGLAAAFAVSASGYLSAMETEQKKNIQTAPSTLGKILGWAPAVIIPILGCVLASYQKKQGVSTPHAAMTIGFSTLPLITKITKYDEVVGALPVWSMTVTSVFFDLLGKTATEESTKNKFGQACQISKCIENPWMFALNWLFSSESESSK